MKKRRILFLTAAAAILAMTACQNTSQNQTNAAKEVKAEDVPENAAEEAVLQYLTADFLEDMELYIESCAEYMRSSML